MRTVGVYLSSFNSTEFQNKVGTQKADSMWWAKFNHAVKYPPELTEGTASQHCEFGIAEIHTQNFC